VGYIKFIRVVVHHAIHYLAASLFIHHRSSSLLSDIGANSYYFRSPTLSIFLFSAVDGLSAAASVVGIVTIVAQITASIKQLHDFWFAVKDAPVSLQLLFCDLQFMCGLLDAIKTSLNDGLVVSGNEVPLKGLLGRCQETPPRQILGNL
jgi:hypothetical protein